MSRFQKGQSGNPGGRPLGLDRRLRERFGDDVEKIVEVLKDLALGRNPDGYAEEIKTSDRIKAGAEVIDRVIGKARQTVEGDLSIGVSPEQLAMLAALQLSPHERSKRLAEIAAEDDAELAAAETAVDDPGE